MSPRSSMTDRMRGAALLDERVYEEVEADTTATGQAAGVVVLVAVAQGIGAAGVGIAEMIGAMVVAVLGFVPVLGALVRFGVAVWTLVAGIVAIRQALDFGTGKAILTAVLGWLALVVPMALLAAAGS